MSQNLFSAYFRRVFGDTARRRFGRKDSRPRQQYRCSPRQNLEVLEDRVLLFQFADVNRWQNTAFGNGGLTQGDPTILTWGLADDGSPIAGLAGEQAGDSKLIASLDSKFGAGPGGTDLTQRPWFPIFNSAFGRLGELSGLTYLYEAADDGAAFSNVVGSNPGLPGVRPDIRIGGHKIDGDGAKLAYTLAPDLGDIVVDTIDIFDFANSSANNFRFFRNTLMHEGGHSVGIDHVMSSDAAFLMEPTVSISASYDGPQLDDILALQRGYGDALEKSGGNNTPATATDLGTFAPGSARSRGTLGSTTTVAPTDKDFLSIDDESDFDFFKFTIADPMTMSFKVTPRGTTYQEGPESSQIPQAPFNAAAQSNLGLKLLGEDGTTILQLENVNGLGGMETIANYALPAAGTYYVKVFGTTTNKTQLYGLDVTADSEPVGLSIADAVVTEGTDATAEFTVTLAKASSKPVTVDYFTANVSALEGSDYSNATGTLTFAPGETVAKFTVPILDDSRVEANETFFAKLTNAINSSIADSHGLGTIQDNDVLPTLSINDVSVTEGTGGTQNAVFTVTLSRAYEDPVTVDFATANGSAVAGDDFTSNTGTLNFAAGETTQTVAVAIVGDTLFEDAEKFFVILSGATNATISDPYGEGTIKDNDLVTTKLSINDVTVTEGTGGTVNAVFTVSLSAPSGTPVTVKYTTANSTAISPDDYTATSDFLTIPAGEVSGTISVSVVSDSSYELSQAFLVNLSSATNALIADTQGKCTILDDDLPPGLSVSDVSVTEKTGSTVTAVFIVSLSEPSSLPVKVNYATASNSAVASDYLSKHGTLLFAPGQVSKTLTISVLGDARDELDEDFFMNLSVPVNATIADGQGQCAITDDDATPTLTIENKSVTEGTGSFTKAIFTVRLSAISGLPVTVSYATAGDTAIDLVDYMSVNNSLTFVPGQISKTISVPIVGDALDEANESFFVNLSGSNYATIANGQAQGTIIDNDALPKLSIGNITVTEGDSGTVNAVFTVKLSAASGQLVTVTYATIEGSAIAGSDYSSLIDQTLTFAPGETTKTISVSILGDAIREQLSKTFSIRLSGALNALFANAQGIGTILDND